MSIGTKRIGVDVGGTNTDGVLLDPTTAPDSQNRGILAWCKTPTTPNPSDGIETCIAKLLKDASADLNDIASVSIGTTHFINAVVEKDSNRLSPVAVIRLCGPFSRECYPGIDWPSDLASIICQYCGFVDGGLEVDGDVIRDVVEAQIEEQCSIIRDKGIRSVVINGIFSPSDFVERQEERVGEWIKTYYPEADVILSKHVANLGFIERENAAILNASILPFARATISSFQNAITRLKLHCPVFLTQNDGTLLPAALAAQVPIKTFNSGPTNSMCGAAFLVKHRSVETGTRRTLLVADIGGTTTDVGVILPSGLPRQASAITDVSGVRMNFSCPDVKSIGLGGGSVVRKSSLDASLTIGPDSVGHNISTQALAFGGDVTTATDYAIAASLVDLGIGDASRISDAVRNSAAEFSTVLQTMLEGIIDAMKTNADDIDVLLVGGGAILVPDGIKLKGAGAVVKPEYSGVANAIGAAIARVSGTVDTILSVADRSTKQVLDSVSSMARDRAVQNGALRQTVELAEIDVIPVQYVANKVRVIVKAVGDYDYSGPAPLRELPDDRPEASHASEAPASKSTSRQSAPSTAETYKTPSAIEGYLPHVTAIREWIVSEIDLEWISTGCYILGTGGGGTPYPHFVRVREMMRKGSTIRIISPDDLKDEALVACGGGKGSPTVGIEKLSADEMMESQTVLYGLINRKPDAVIALEIGGGNGLQGLLLGASSNMNIPVVDADWMGRAYPVSWQITPVVWGGDAAQFIPQVIADGNGNVMIFHKGTTEKMIERAFRAALAEMGSHVACAKGPYTGFKTKAYGVQHTLSLAWRIGRAVALCRARNQIDDVANVIINSVGGPETARLLFKGKIVAVERKTVKGHVYGEAVIAAADNSERIEDVGAQLTIPFKNENLIATRKNSDGTSTIIASVPDLICVIDAASGEAIGTPEYRYGLHVFVLGITASDKWTSTQRGLDIGGPRAFGLDIDYKPLGVFKKPRSVIDQYGPP